jgi:glycosyltransferase involved in cell wall biosynthesis
MAKKPLVSVVMTVYNEERYLKDAIDSVTSQTYEDIELLIVNDGSTDRSKRILDSYNDPRIKVTHTKHQGISKAKNIAFRQATGTYVALHDADDISFPNRIEVQVEFLEKRPDIALTGAYIRCIDEEGRDLKTFIIGDDPRDFGETMIDWSRRFGGITIYIKENHEEIRKALLRCRNCIMHGTVMFRREILDEVGLYDEGLRYAVDYEFYLRVSERHKLANIPRVLYKQRVHKGRESVLYASEQKKCMLDVLLRWKKQWEKGRA